ncbi:MAG: hypothetical protein ABSB28_11310 [Candidatus Bathyarchaeia archaeon]
MMKLKLLTLTLVLAILMPTTLLSTCKAQTEQVSLKFNAVATGECLVLIESILGPQPPKAFFIARGAIAISGSALATEVPPSQDVPFPYYITNDGVNAVGAISARGEGQMITAHLYSEGEVSGLFANLNDADWFFAGALPGGSLTPSMSYEGLYKDSTGVHKVSGKAAVLACLMGDPGSQFWGIGAILLKPDGSPLLSIVWALTDVTLGPGGAMGTLHAANQFIHSVRVRAP